jgi:hypothetical protein
LARLRVVRAVRVGMRRLYFARGRGGGRGRGSKQQGREHVQERFGLPQRRRSLRCRIRHVRRVPERQAVHDGWAAPLRRRAASMRSVCDQRRLRRRTDLRADDAAVCHRLRRRWELPVDRADLRYHPRCLPHMHERHRMRRRPTLLRRRHRHLRRLRHEHAVSVRGIEVRSAHGPMRALSKRVGLPGTTAGVQHVHVDMHQPAGFP